MLFKSKREKAISELDEIYTNNIIANTDRIYANKSSDEYKCKGDITKVSIYDRIELTVAQLDSIKFYPTADSKAMHDLFNALHRPIFHKMVTEYMSGNKTDRNVLFASLFTIGYRLLIGELARVYTSTEATQLGFVYKPNKISRKESTMPLIKKFNNDLDKNIDKLVIKMHKDAKINNKAPLVQEGVLETINDTATLFVAGIESVFGVFNNIFKTAASMNPIALISALLSRSYDKKVAKYDAVSKEYEVAKKLYDDYKKLPPAQQSKRRAHKYEKMIEKYNIKMQNLKAQIDHYDTRAEEEAKEKELTKAKTDTPSSNNASSTSNSNSNNKSSSADDDFDF